jgi:hypothetical protein
LVNCEPRAQGQVGLCTSVFGDSKMIPCRTASHVGCFS